MGIVQGYMGGAKIGTVQVPSQPGSYIGNPEGYQMPGIIDAREYDYHYIQGLRVPSASIILPPDVSWLTATLVNAMLTRTLGDIAAVTGGITVCDGDAGLNLTGAKLAGMDFVWNFGQAASVTLQFLGNACADVTMVAASLAPIAARAEYAAFKHFKLTAPGTLKVTSLRLSVSTGVTPNPELANSEYPSEVNAGKLTATASMTVQSNAVIPADGTPIVFEHATGVATGVEITLANPVFTGRDRRATQPARAMRTLSAQLFGETDDGAPVVFADA
jgi:hypothetical protein